MDCIFFFFWCHVYIFIQYQYFCEYVLGSERFFSKTKTLNYNVYVLYTFNTILKFVAEAKSL